MNQKVVEAVGAMGTLTTQRMDEVRGARERNYMDSYAVLVTEVGLVQGRTRIWTRQPWIGWTGAVRLLAMDVNDVILGYTAEHSYGVDGFRIPFKSSDRRVIWFDTLENVGGATRIELMHYYAPKNRIEAMLREARDIGQTFANALGGVQAIGAAMG